MSEKPLTVAELEALAAKSEEHADYCRRTGASPAWSIDWPGTLAKVCRQALAQAKEVERLRGLLVAERDRMRPYEAAIASLAADYIDHTTPEQLCAAISRGKEEPQRCPTCDSPDPDRHPAMQWEGEVQPCRDAWHVKGKASTP